MPKPFKLICFCYLLLHGHVLFLIAQPRLKFEHLTTADGLPSNMNYHIFQDHLGFLWFSNQCGLVRYDGYQCLTFVPDNKNPYSISTAHVNQVCEDSRGDLWISSEIRGINKYERKSSKFYHFNHDPKDNTSLLSDSVFKCYMDRSDILWIVHANGMLDRLDSRISEIIHNPHLPGSTHFSIGYTIMNYGFYLNLIVVTEDSNGNIWFGTDAGAFFYNRKKNSFRQYHHDLNNPNSINCDTVTGFYEDKNDLIWIATWGGSLNCFNPETNSFSSYRHVGRDKNSISSNLI